MKKESRNVMLSRLHLARKAYQLNTEGKGLKCVERTVSSLTFSIKKCFFTIS